MTSMMVAAVTSVVVGVGPGGRATRSSAHAGRRSPSAGQARMAGEIEAFWREAFRVGGTRSEKAQPLLAFSEGGSPSAAEAKTLWSQAHSRARALEPSISFTSPFCVP